MSTVKISELTALSSADAADELVIVDDSAGVTKKITAANLNASFDVSALDDYDEGTFTPVLENEYGSVTVGGSAAFNGEYKKIGNLVTCQIYIDADDSGIAVDDRIRFTGLPFAPIDVPNYGAAVGVVADLANSSGGVASFGQVFILASGSPYEFAVWITHVDGSPSSWRALGTFSYFAN